MLYFHVLVAVLLSNLALCQKLIIPDSIKPCQPTDITWDPLAPNTSKGPLDVISNFEVSFVTNAPDGTLYELAFSNISSAGFSFIPNFHPYSQVLVQQQFNGSLSFVDLKNISVGVGGSDDCILPDPTSSLNPPPTNPSTPLLIEFELLTSLSQCQITHISWSGGESPYSLKITGDPNTSPSTIMYIRNVVGTLVDTIVPLWASFGSYTVSVVDHLNRSTTVDNIEISPSTGSTKDCLIHVTDLSTASNTPQPSSTPSASDTNIQTNTKRRTLIIVISVILGVLFCLVLAAIAFRQIKIKQRQRKLRAIQNRFKDRQNDVRLGDLKSPQEFSKM